MCERMYRASQFTAINSKVVGRTFGSRFEASSDVAGRSLLVIVNRIFKTSMLLAWDSSLASFAPCLKRNLTRAGYRWRVEEEGREETKFSNFFNFLTRSSAFSLKNWLFFSRSATESHRCVRKEKTSL